MENHFIYNYILTFDNLFLHCPSVTPSPTYVPVKPQTGAVLKTSINLKS